MRRRNCYSLRAMRLFCLKWAPYSGLRCVCRCCLHAICAAAAATVAYETSCVLLLPAFHLRRRSCCSDLRAVRRCCLPYAPYSGLRYVCRCCLLARCRSCCSGLRAVRRCIARQAFTATLYDVFAAAVCMPCALAICNCHSRLRAVQPYAPCSGLRSARCCCLHANSAAAAVTAVRHSCLHSICALQQLTMCSPLLFLWRLRRRSAVSASPPRLEALSELRETFNQAMHLERIFKDTMEPNLQDVSLPDHSVSWAHILAHTQHRLEGYDEWVKVRVLKLEPGLEQAIATLLQNKQTREWATAYRHYMRLLLSQFTAMLEFNKAHLLGTMAQGMDAAAPSLSVLPPSAISARCVSAALSTGVDAVLSDVYVSQGDAATAPLVRVPPDEVAMLMQTTALPPSQATPDPEPPAAAVSSEQQ
eukprot:TRINITY_DN3186_c0_g1_i3.p1 TRINITY_DN3186_c0_g1~~TRINITY_DN3186_c0_g1_i3.p1  ORF type:complete len:418 (-),score=61.17 TRINITY_DN3186_c0_g1_i3:93-1346(-)